MAKLRFAGARLAAAPVEDVTEDLKIALEALNKSRQNVPGFSREVDVPGTDARVYLNASADYLPQMPTDVDGVKVLGNKQQVQLLKDLDSPGVVSLAWSSSGDRDASPGTKLRIGRAAERGWKDALKELPENTIVTNTPIGASSGDFERADLYTRKGFGPVQTDGTQYGIVRAGKIEPLSPFVPDEAHLRHLADRAYEAGDMETNDLVRRALNDRRRSNIDQQLEEAAVSKRGNYDDRYDYDDYDDDYYEPPPLTRQDQKQAVEEYLAGGYSGNGDLGQGRPPEIELRDQVGNRYRGGSPQDYQPTPQDIELFRQQQVAAMEIPSGARDQIDVINNYSPRPVPQPITVSDLESERSSWRPRIRPFDEIDSSSMEGRRLQMIDAVRASQSGVSAVGYDHDPSVIRDRLKRAAVMQQTNPEPGALGVIRQEFYGPEDVQALRNWQEAQARNWPVDSPMRTPPPMLNPDGSVASRRPTPAEAIDGSNSHLTGLGGRDQIIPGTTVLNRGRLSPEQEQAVERLVQLRRTPTLVDDNLRRLDGWFNEGASAQIFRRLVEADGVDDLTAGVQARPMTGDRLQRDLEVINTANTQPGNVPRRVFAQAVADLRAFQAGGYGGLNEEINRLQGLVDQANLGPAAPHREFNVPSAQPPQPSAEEQLFAPRPPRRRASRRLAGEELEQPKPRFQQQIRPVDEGDVFARPSGERAVKPEGFRLRGPAADELDALERMLEGF